MDCPYCKKKTNGGVNWLHGEDGNWYHECWECECVFSTPEKLPEPPKDE